MRDVEKAVHLYQQAIDINPGYALGLGSSRERISGRGNIEGTAIGGSEQDEFSPHSTGPSALIQTRSGPITRGPDLR